MDKQREDEICKIFEDIVKKHPDATADEGSLPDDMRFIPLEFWQAAQAAMQAEIDRLKKFEEFCGAAEYPTLLKLNKHLMKNSEELEQQLKASLQFGATMSDKYAVVCKQLAELRALIKEHSEPG